MINQNRGKLGKFGPWFLMASMCGVAFACGPRRKIDAPTPEAVSRGPVSIKQNPWDISTVNGKVQDVDTKYNEGPLVPSIKVFFIKNSLTTSDGDDFSINYQINSWFSSEPTDLAKKNVLNEDF